MGFGKTIMAVRGVTLSLGNRGVVSLLQARISVTGRHNPYGLAFSVTGYHPVWSLNVKYHII